MNCCFLCSSFKPIDTTRSEVPFPMGEYLEKEKLCEELCKNITKNAESTDNSICTLSVPNVTLLPDINSDDIEGILHQISELLTPRSVDNSQKTELDDDSRSVEEILKEAENLVRASTPYFDKLSSESSSSWTSLPKLPNKAKKNVRNKRTKSPLKLLSVKDLVSSYGGTNSINESMAQETDKSNTHLEIIGEDIENGNNEDSLPIINRNLESEKQHNDNLNDNRKLENTKEDKDEQKISGNIERRQLSISDLVMPCANDTITLTKPSFEFLPKASQDSHESENAISGADFGKFQKVYEDQLCNMQKQITILNNELGEYKKKGNINNSQERISILEEENKSQQQLILSYQKENQRLTSDLTAAKDVWKEAEVKLLEQIKHLDRQMKTTIDINNNEVRTLRENLNDAKETVRKLEIYVKTIKAEKRVLEESNEELTVDVTKLRCEVEEYKKDLYDWGKKERNIMNTLESNSVLQGKLSQANTEVTKKQTEIVRLNGDIGKLRGELERIRLGSVINHPSESLSITISQLQAALNLERDNTKEILKEKDAIHKENLDLKRQVKELEGIVKRRVKSSNNLPFGFDGFISSAMDPKKKESIELRNKELENHAAEMEAKLIQNQDIINNLEANFDIAKKEHNEGLKKLQEENSTLKQALDDTNFHKLTRKGSSASMNANAAAVKEDAHLLATIRGLKLELSGREKEIMRLNKELEDSRKTNRRLQKEREKVLNTPTKPSRGPNKEVEKVHPMLNSGCLGKNYNPLLYEEDPETILFLRTENKTLRDEIKRLEQDLITLHNKRIQDLTDLQQEHDTAMAQLLREHASKHSTSTVSHLQGQIYTQQMVIGHLKQQIKEFEERVEEIPVLKIERDELESTLMEANKKIARLHDLASPESMQYSGLLEKLEFLERRHQVREQKLQSIVRDLIARQSQANSLCSSSCRDKLMNKNREICYYRAEMDRILDTLTEFKWGV